MISKTVPASDAAIQSISELPSTPYASTESHLGSSAAGRHRTYALKTKPALDIKK